MSPLRSFLIAQGLGALIAVALVQIVHPGLFDTPLWVGAIQAVCATYVAHKMEAERWWLPIHLLFLPAALLLLRAGIDPLWYLAGFVLIVLVYWRTDKSRVPLYLTNAPTAAALAELLPAGPCHIVDLGCGNGGLLRRLAKARPDCEFLGVEHAPATWLWAWLGSLGRPNLRIRLGDFWQLRLGLFEVAYAFLSPAPMASLWQKAVAEMRPGSLLISNSFPIPEIEAKNIVKVDDSRTSALYCYHPSPSAGG